MVAASIGSVADKTAFQDQTYVEGRERFHFYTVGQKLFVAVHEADKPPQHLPILYAFGVWPLQQYLVSQPGGRLQALTVAWDVAARRWYSVQDATTGNDTSHTLHWRGRFQNWNAMCAECHSTGVRKGYSIPDDRYSTTWIASNVGCQACHGPGAAHARGARKGKPGTIIRYGALSPAQIVDFCGTCHSRRVSVGDAPALSPGFKFLDHFQPELLRQRLFYPDGQQYGEVFEYASYRQSRMYAAGVSCTNCHDAHTGKTRLPGNALCTQCHSKQGVARFPGLQAKRYDSREHHGHASNSAATQCVTCHMPTKTYMGIHERRDHAIRVPRPDLTQRIGVPNACTTQCHLDRDAAWASGEIRARGGRRAERPHYGAVIAAGRRGDENAVPALGELAVAPEVPGIVRATAIEELGRYGIAPAAELALDGDPLVRLAVADNAASGLSPRTLSGLRPLLFDSSNSVRLAVARRFAGLSSKLFTPAENARIAAGVAAYRHAQSASADFPAAWLNLAGLDLDLNDNEAAEAKLVQALRRDRGLPVARVELARIQALSGRIDDAEITLRYGLALAPTDAELLLSLALIRAQRGALMEALSLLELAYKAAPDHPRIRKNLAALRTRLGDQSVKPAEQDETDVSR
ncbi:MAG: hypothetical protein KF778_13695 [Rhodocyclaceae bacterium]|nr:hypothetical protein [Rhodocyclaceae bacterium]